MHKRDPRLNEICDFSEFQICSFPDKVYIALIYVR